MPLLRLLPTLDADGPTQMAWDEALLTSAAATTLRLYRWTPPAVSLGCFQDFASATAQLPPGMPVVRRITGGGAIWHEHEVTYCLVGRLGQDGLPADGPALYPLIHGAINRALADHGGGLDRQTATTGDRRYRAEPRCFASPAADDLVHSAGGKVLGSAARVRGDRVLLHGSLKLASNPWDGPAAAGCGLSWGQAEPLLHQAFARALGATLRGEPPSAGEEAEMRAILAARYGDDRWLRERAGLRP